tara:strand:+ start:450 stop:1118 length:669 start_codon:yes stop_codon:yes gene_type:complete
MSEIFLDTETTGLSYKEGHKILEIACIETEELLPTKKKFHKFINPKREVSSDAFKVHGFSNDFLKDKPTFNLIAKDFVSFIKNKKIIIHNAPFDLGFINNELRTNKMDPIEDIYIVDTLELARSKFPGSSNSLDALCKRFNIDLSKRLKHNALLDCELLREVYIHLLDAKEPKLFSNLINIKSDNQNDNDVTNYNKEIIEPSVEEIKLHENFLSKDIKKNYF